jgi:hypothetical protein
VFRAANNLTDISPLTMGAPSAPEFRGHAGRACCYDPARATGKRPRRASRSIKRRRRPSPWANARRRAGAGRGRPQQLPPRCSCAGGRRRRRHRLSATHARLGFLSARAADLLNDRVLPFFDSHEVKLLRVLTDRGSEHCGNPERHEYESLSRDRGYRSLAH